VLKPVMAGANMREDLGMTGGFKMSAGRLSLITAAGLLLIGGATAQAADLGGDCCADLEERIAELEATTARKGNRKVKLEVSGHVNEAVLYWDDSFEDNVYVVTNDAARTRFRFKGDAKISDGFKAGYLLEVGVRSANSKRFTQDDPTGETGFDVRHSVWYLDSKTFGRVWVGLTGGAGEGVTEINVAGTGDVAKFSDAEDMGGGLSLRRANGTYSSGLTVVGGGDITIRRLIRDSGNQAGEGRRYNMLRYDTPEIAGFTATANWGADDTWEIGLRYKGEFSGFKMAAGVAYGETSEPPAGGAIGFECVANRVVGANIGGTGKDADCNQFGASGSIMHEETGLYVNAAYGILEDELLKPRFGAATDDEHQFYAVEAGIQKKWIPLGKTTIFGQYYNADGGATDRTYTTAGRMLNSELDIYSLGIMQGVDAAAMNLYAMYRHVEAEATTTNGGGVGVAGTIQFEDVDMFMSGAIIKF
jgi:predicted porin